MQIPKTKLVALVSVFSAFYVVLSLLPGIPVIGLPVVTIELEASFAPIFGIVLGPYLGFLSALIGTVIAWIIPPAGMPLAGIPFLLCPSVSALVTGYVYRGKWKITVAIIGSIIALFWATPLVHPLSNFWHVGIFATWDKILAWLLIFPTVAFMKELSETIETRPIYYWLLGFIGNQADSALGCLVFATPIVYEGIFGLPLNITRYLFIVAPLAYVVIRAFQAFICAVLAIPVVRQLKKMELMLP